MKNNLLYICLAGFLSITAGCSKQLDVSPESEFAPGNVLTSENGIKAVLYSSYASFQNQIPSRVLINISEVTTDMAFNSGGAENLYLSQFINFTWDPSIANFQVDVWGPSYRVIRDANIVLENIDAVNTSDATKAMFRAEARTLRAQAYTLLKSWFGTVPLRRSSLENSELPRASEEELNSFIETELLEATADLPNPGDEAAFGRFNKGVSMSILAKFYLNTKQWQKAADACQTVMNFNYYELFPSFTGLFRVENEGNKEMILALPCRNEDGFGNWFMAGALPPGFRTTPQIPEFTWTLSMANFATQYRLRSGFVNTMDPDDDRGILVLKTYVNAGGNTVNLMSTPDNARSMKYWDNGTLGNHSGTDVPIIRYADILLSRAEALNELNGPSQAVLDLIDDVRNRSGLGDLVLADFPSKEALRDHILKERGWEFISEGKRREDLIRQGKFISMAQARGANAQNYHVVFPIPQSEVDANDNLEQTDGYK